MAIPGPIVYFLTTYECLSYIQSPKLWQKEIGEDINSKEQRNPRAVKIKATLGVWIRRVFGLEIKKNLVWLEQGNRKICDGPSHIEVMTCPNKRGKVEQKDVDFFF